ncbi:hypothetical protein RHSIM_Rhsim04G0162200 [Rhododendron simsii]|uniref:uracil phosphoribosyltransferase n=1 Tax=Rhododendron simsii TaxID=118357 RepID=A0A834LPV5_RHOSS|nr:hypothetical protein RHSIM_Rhsim04G0162200 [Rhododendron simsii]
MRPFVARPMRRFSRLLTTDKIFENTISFPPLSIPVSTSNRRRRSSVVVKSQTTMPEKSLTENRMLVFVPPHPLIKHWVSVLRNEQTPCPIFKNAMAELGRLLIYEASRDCMPTITGEIQSPMGVASVDFIDPREPVAVIPILRAGLALAENASSVLPALKTYHLGISRDEETLQPTVYLNKLPDTFPEGSRVFVVDPMLATGGTVVAALDLIKERGVDNTQIKVVSAVAAPPALQKLSEKFPGLQVYAGIIDPTVNEKGFIIPGLGDAGDRSFATMAGTEDTNSPILEGSLHHSCPKGGAFLGSLLAMVSSPKVDTIDLLERASLPSSDHLMVDPSDAEGLSYVARAVRIPLYADTMTETCQRLNYAKICVEIDVNAELPESFDVVLANGACYTIKEVGSVDLPVSGIAAYSVETITCPEVLGVLDGNEVVTGNDTIDGKCGEFFTGSPRHVGTSVEIGLDNIPVEKVLGNAASTSDGKLLCY